MKYLTFLFWVILIFSSKTVFGQLDLLEDYYDNRDHDHANMPISLHPQLSKMSSGYGIQNVVIPDTIVFGNASLAYTTGVNWGSLIRVRNLRNQAGMTRAYNLYVNNNAYWYPEHKDHDLVDYFFAQAPMLNNSQGSSGSEIDEMHKWFYALDSFSVSTKNALKSNKLLIPTMQMIARRSRVATDSEYLTGKAHPNAFDNADVRAEMEALAAEMTPDNFPPMVQIEVVEEDYNLGAKDSSFWLFEPSVYPLKKENMHETPVSITRIWHGLQYTKRMVMSAETSFDANGLPLTYHWVVLRGDPAHVFITPLNGDNSKVEILIDYHSEDTILGESRLTNLVSIGAFVHNGHYYSAPAFVTSYTKRNEERVYNQTTKKIESITYNHKYLDPQISNEKDWDSDVFSYDMNGEFAGWIRIKGSDQDTFTKEGYVVLESDIDGNPYMVSKVKYSKSGTITIWQNQGQPFLYSVVDVQEYPQNNDVSVYPNPMQKSNYVFVKVENGTNFSPIKVDIYSVKGELLKSVEATGYEIKIDMSGLSATSYLFHVHFVNEKGQNVMKTITMVD